MGEESGSPKSSVPHNDDSSTPSSELDLLIPTENLACAKSICNAVTNNEVSSSSSPSSPFPGFVDLFDLEEIQKLQDSFALATGVASIITAPDGTPITKPSNFCRLCNDVIRKTDKGLKNCMHSDAVIGQPNPQGPTIQPCLSGGLWDGGASIKVDNVHIANWLIGQVRNDEQSEENMLAYAREIGADEVEFGEALKEVTMMSNERFSAICDSLFLMANMISNMAYQNQQQSLLITELEEAEESLSEAHDELEQRVQDRTLELEQSLENLEQTQKVLIESEKMAALGGLVSGVSHELNTPLGICVTATSLLEENFLHLSSMLDSPSLSRADIETYQSDVSEAMSLLSQSLNRAVQLVQTFKLVSVDEYVDQHSDFDLMELLRNLSDTINSTVKMKPIHLVLSGPESLSINSCPRVILQVITHLIDNSVDHGFGQSGGNIVVQVSKGDSQIQIIYQDDGSGIKDDQLLKIFDPFYTTRRGEGNAGLGLHIVYNLVTQKLKGNIHCETNRPVGAMFTINLPIAMVDP